MPNVFYREPRHPYPIAVRGEGVYVYDESGRQYLDGSGGAGVSCLGHGHPAVVEAIRSQAEEMAFAHTLFFSNLPQEKLAEKLAKRFGEEDARVYFCSGGSEANETAIKLVRQYWIAAGQEQKHIVISRHQSYHGNTLGALSVSSSAERRQPYAPLLHDWPRIEPCYEFRHRRDDESLSDYAGRAAGALEAAILSAGAENVAGFIAETIVGASLGAVLAVDSYFQQIREICDRHQVLWIGDEIMAGAGRSGTYFAFEKEGVKPDIVTLAKGLAGGYQPLGAVIARGFIHREVAEVFGSFTHGHTFVGHATATAAGLAVMQVLEKEDLLKSVGRMGDYLKNALADAFREHPHVGDIRGRGLFVGLEFVRDRKTMAGIASEKGVPRALRQAAMDNGLICYPGGGTVDGVEGAHMLLAPPFIYQIHHADELVDKLAKTLAKIEFV